MRAFVEASLGLSALIFFGLLCSSAHASAIQYQVNRTLLDVESGVNGSLVGTVNVKLGEYTIVNESPHPFRDVDLLLTVGEDSVGLTGSTSDFVRGTARFYISATPTHLVFNTTDADAGNPAIMVFGDDDEDRYTIGWDAAPGFEVGRINYRHSGAHVNFPVEFGVAVPEPHAIALLGLGLVGLAVVRWKRR